LLEQASGNSAAIGAKITIHYGESENLRQRKEIKLSGGFMSFDNTAVHFGIGRHESIESFSVTWPDGRTTEYAMALPANHFYRVRRK